MAAMGSTFTVRGALVRPLLVVWICTVPVATVAGTRKFTRVLLTKLTGTAVPLMVTPTPSTSVGSVLPVTCQLPDAYLTEPVVAELCGLSVALFLKWRSSRTGPPFLKLGRLVRYSRAQVLPWLEEQLAVDLRDWQSQRTN